MVIVENFEIVVIDFLLKYWNGLCFVGLVLVSLVLIVLVMYFVFWMVFCVIFGIFFIVVILFIMNMFGYLGMDRLGSIWIWLVWLSLICDCLVRFLFN